MKRPRLKMDEFVRVARKVVDELPENLRTWLDNVTIDVELEPWPELLKDMDLSPDEQPLGLFVGTMINEREYGEAPLNRIYLFKRPIEDACESTAEIEYEIRRTILHELAHHFGFEERDLEAFEARPSPFREGSPTDQDDGDEPAT